MTWFGIVMLAYYALNVAGAFYYAGKGGLSSTPGSLMVTAFFNALFLAAILFVGTGTGVL